IWKLLYQKDKILYDYFKGKGKIMSDKDRVISRWDGKPIPKRSPETQKEIDEYEKTHTDHPEFYPDYYEN
ncbi:MAG: hypothetical protein RSE60_08810, partial [Erysipelotrichaceae bacterium]